MLKKIIASFISVIFAACLVSSPAYADTMTNNQNTDPSTLIPLEITPTCSDAASSTASWNVNNKNTTSVNVAWTNIDNGQTGSYSAAPGMTILTTYFDSTDPNNTTQFVSETNTTQTNATEAACNSAPTQPTGPTSPTQPTNPTPTCVDGTIQQNLVTTFTSPNSINVHTANGAPLCASVTINFSSYVMPSNYDGRGFYVNGVANPTAYPQSLYTNQTMTLAAGTDGSTTFTISLPDSCENSQVDLYYGAVQTTIGASGTGTSNIISQINPSTGACPTGPTSSTGGNPGRGGDMPTSPVTTVSAPITAVPAPTVETITPAVSTQPQLAYTGESPVTPYLIAFSVLAATTGLSWVVRRDGRNFS